MFVPKKYLNKSYLRNVRFFKFYFMISKQTSTNSTYTTLNSNINKLTNYTNKKQIQIVLQRVKYRTLISYMKFLLNTKL